MSVFFSLIQITPDIVWISLLEYETREIENLIPENKLFSPISLPPLCKKKNPLLQKNVFLLLDRIDS